MSLVAWYPLNNTDNNINCINKGLDGINLNTMGNIEYSNSGKIGSAPIFDNNSSKCFYRDPFLYEKNFSWSVWFKINGNTSNTFQFILSEGRDYDKYGCNLAIDSDNNLRLICGTWYSIIICKIDINKWYNVVLTYGEPNINIYVNGELIKYIGYAEPDYTYAPKFVIGKMSYAYTSTSHYHPFNGLINDVRVYDHCLSVKEIKEISKGLVLHYKLDNNGYGGTNLVKGTDVASLEGWGKSGWYGTITTKSVEEKTYRLKADGGWSVYGYDMTDYIGKELVLSCDMYWDEENSGDKGNIMLRLFNSDKLYYGGSDRILLEKNTWTHVQIPIKSSKKYIGFFLRSAGGDNTTVNLLVYFKNFKIEEGNIATPWCPNPNDALYTALGFNDNIEYDCSGYGYDGTKIGTAMTPVTDTPRYNSCIKIPDNTSHIVTPVMNMKGFADSYTISWWEKASGINSAMPWGFSNGNRLNVYHCSYLSCNTGDSDSNKFSPPIHIDSVIDDNWHHMVLTGDGSENKLYIDGKYMATAPTYRKLTGSQIYLSNWDSGSSYPWLNGSLSDFRIYATVLSEEDIKKLYNASAFVDNEGNVYSYNFDDSIDHLKVNNKGIFNHGNFEETDINRFRSYANELKCNTINEI